MAMVNFISERYIGKYVFIIILLFYIVCLIRSFFLNKLKIKKLKVDLILIFLVTVVILILYQEAERSNFVRSRLEALSNKGEKAIRRFYHPSISLEEFRDKAEKSFGNDEYNPITYDDLIHEASPGNYTITQKGKKFFFNIYGINGHVYKIVEFSKEKNPSKLAMDLLHQGFSYEKSEEYEQAIDRYTQAIEVDPKKDIFYAHRGFLYHKLKIYGKAINDYNKGIELDPKNSYAYNNRGNVYYELKQYKKASKFSLQFNQGFFGRISNCRGRGI